MSEREDNTTDTGVASNSDRPHASRLPNASDSHFSISIDPHKREVKLPQNSGFWIGATTALLFVVLLLVYSA